MTIENPNEPSTTSTTPSVELQNLASSELNEVKSRAKEDLSAVSEQAASDVRELGNQAQEKIGEVTDKAKSFAVTQKDLAATQINAVASAVFKVAEELDNTDQQSVARYARDLANGISKVGNQIENRDIDDLMGAAQDFGRSQPVAFLGVAALAGFVASRFALASNHRRETQTSSRASQPEVYGASSNPSYPTSGPDNQAGGQ